MERCMSDASLFLSEGLFPSWANFPQSVINIVARFSGTVHVGHVVSDSSDLLITGRMKCVPDGNTWRRVEVNVADHVHEHREGDGDTEEQIENCIAAPMREDMPLWDIHVFHAPSPSHWKLTGDGDIVVVRIHHAIGDGMSLLHLFASTILRTSDGRLLVDGDSPPWSTSSSHYNSKKPLLMYRLPFGGLFFATRLAISSFLGSYDLEYPFTSPMSVKRHGISNTGRRRMYVSDPIPLEALREIARETGCTVNTIAIAAFTEGLRVYIRHRSRLQVIEGDGDGEADLLLERRIGEGRVCCGRPRHQCRILVAATGKRTFHDVHNDEDTLTNTVSFLPLSLPLEEDCPLGRMQKIDEQMAQLMLSGVYGAGHVVSSLLRNVCSTHTRQEAMLGLFSRHSFVWSNVRGPEEEFECFGGKVCDVRMAFYSPLPAISLISCGGTRNINNGVFGRHNMSDGWEEIGKVYFTMFGDPNILLDGEVILKASADGIEGIHKEMRRNRNIPFDKRGGRG